MLWLWLEVVAVAVATITDTVEAVVVQVVWFNRVSQPPHQPSESKSVMEAREAQVKSKVFQAKTVDWITP